MILEILNEINSSRSVLNKRSILKREKGNALLKEVFRLAYDPFINFWQKKIPPFSSTGENASLNEALLKLKLMMDRTVTGHAAVEYFQNLLSSLNEGDAEVLSRIISRDLRCGAGATIANQIWPGLIPTFDVCLAHKDISGIKFPAYAQTKMNGARCHLYFNGKDVKAYARSGKIFNILNALNSSAKSLMRPGETFDGEILFFKNGKPLDRETSNGLANKALKETLTPAEAEMARLVVWDIVDHSSTIPYKDRWEDLVRRVTDSKIILVHCEIVNSVSEANAFFEKMISDGHEGAIIKNMNFKWIPDRTKETGKMKAEEEADLLVIGWTPGGGKYEGLLGSLQCVTSDGLIEAFPGTGFSDEQRQDPQSFVGKIVTVKYNQKIKSKNDNRKMTLYLSRFVEVRFDKNVANSAEELK